MGGYNSGRWGWHSKKTQVEECFKLTILFFKPYLLPGMTNAVVWHRDEQEIGSIIFLVLGDTQATSLRLLYTIGAKQGHPEDFDYTVNLLTTSLAWGGSRYWFECPLAGCRRRVGCLYLPPNGKYFGCRHCYNLTYESQQEGSSSRSFYRDLAYLMQNDYPGINWKDVRAIDAEKETPHLRELEYERYLWERKDYDPYEGYLDETELCNQSGLEPAELSKLNEARLLIPDSKDGRYRPKLVSWGVKLTFLLREGWKIEEIKTWSKGRWTTSNPREWPPEKQE